MTDKEAREDGDAGVVHAEGTARDVPEEILDATAGGRSIWYDGNKNRDDTLYIDKREADSGFAEEGFDYEQNYSIKPDSVEDFRDLPYDDESFNLVVFDPPHVIKEDGMKRLAGVVQRRYGALAAETWQDDLRRGFEELFRVLRPGGTLVFKWADRDKPFESVLAQAPKDPLFGTTTTKHGNVQNRWFVFYKPEGGSA